MTMSLATVELGEVLHLNLDRVPIDPVKSYPMTGVYSFGRGLFEREPVFGGNTSYKFFYRLKAEHVVMSQLFGWEGALALSSERFAGTFLSPQFPTFVCNESKLNREFLGWLFRWRSFWEDLATRTKGMGDRRRTLNPVALFATVIPLPPLDEQRRIVARIEALSAKIEESRRLHQEIRDSIDRLYRGIVLGPTKASRTLTAMGELVRLRPADVVVRGDETYGFAGVYSFGKGVFPSQSRSGLDTSYQRLCRLTVGDLVYPKLMAWEGAIGIVPPECDGLYVSTEFPVFEVDRTRVLPEVLDVYFRTPDVWPLLASISTGTNVRRRRLNPAHFLAFKIPLPPMSAQVQLREVKNKGDRLIRLLTDTSAELDALLPSILDKAFKGEL